MLWLLGVVVLLHSCCVYISLLVWLVVMVALIFVYFAALLGFCFLLLSGWFWVCLVLFVCLRLVLGFGLACLVVGYCLCFRGLRFGLIGVLMWVIHGVALFDWCLLFFVMVCLIAISYLGAVDVFGICCLLCCFAR